MARVRVIALESRLDAVLAELQRAGTFEVAHRPEADGRVLGPASGTSARAAREEADRLLLARLQGLLALVPRPQPEPEPPTEGDDDALLASVAEQVASLAPALETAARRRDACHAERTTLPRHLASIRRMLPLVPDPATLRGYDTILLWLDARQSAVLEDLEAHLAALCGPRHELIAARLDTESIGALAILPKKDAASLLELLGSLPAARVRLPAGYEDFTLPEAVAAMARRLAELEPELATLDAKIAGILAPVRARWWLATEAARRRIARLQAAAAAGSTGSVAVLEGWMPTRDIGSLREVLARACPQALLEQVPAPAGADPPVLLENAAAVRPFEVLVRLFGLPRSGGVDPTPWLAAGFPFLVGLMVGDLGHAVCLAALALALRGHRGNRPPWARDVGAAMLVAATWAALFGLVFGEVFGTAARSASWTPLFDRERAVVPLLAAAVALGFAHVVLGQAIGVRATLRQGLRRLALVRAGTVLLVSGAGSAFGAVFGIFPRGAAPLALGAVAAGLVVLLLAAPLQAPLGCLESAGHVLSYLRLAAIGLASVHLSAVATRLSEALPAWAGIPAAVALHGLNVALAVFTPTVQALRLHYVEFFSGFHEGGGTPFAPLSSASPLR